MKIFKLIFSIVLLFFLNSSLLYSQTVSEANHTGLNAGDLGAGANTRNVSNTGWEWVRWAKVSIKESEQSHSRMKAGSAKVLGDPGSSWQAGLFDKGVWSPNGYANKSFVQFRGVENPDATAKQYTPKFEGTVEFFGSGGGSKKEYNWDVKAHYTTEPSVFVLLVEQPLPGVRIPVHVEIGRVGHSFWKTEVPNTVLDKLPDDLKLYANKTYGYYPNPDVSYDNQTAAGILKNDNGHASDVQKSYTIQGISNLENLLRFTKNLIDTPGTYNLQANNCSTVAIQAGRSANLIIPDGYGKYSRVVPWWPFYYSFAGCNPGDLGEDIR